MDEQYLQELLDQYNICYVEGNLPSGSNAFTFCYGDKYLVVVNNRISKHQQKISLYHELGHITGNHFTDFNEDIEHAELKAKKYSSKF